MKILQNSIVRWSAWFLVATVFAITCFFLANWQLERREQAVSKIERMVENFEKPPIGIDELDSASQELINSLEWQPVMLSGEYIVDKQVLVRNRPIAGSPGFIQLVPLELEGGQVIVIERGWIPADSDLAPAATFVPTTESKNVTARIKLSEQSPNRESPSGFATSINLLDLAKLTNLPIEPKFYLRLISESPEETSYPQPLSKPVLDEGNHLSYAVQWILFALMGFFALFSAIRQEKEYQRLEKDPTYVPKSRRNKTLTDGDIEDQILDSNQSR